MFSSQLQTIRSLLDWRVTLDILLIAMGFLFLYRTVRTTGTWKVVSGVLLAAVIFMAARILDLRGIEWIYSNLHQVLVLGLIIIFQPEIRKIFERFASIGPKEMVAEGAKLSYVLSEVLHELAKKRNGAIIVITGKDTISAWTSKGITLNAEPSFPILMSIFDPNSAGHDGAVVIENGKIACFAMRLPLSKSGNLSEEFGTRHHAAMGLSEVTDALVVAVSEERGAITAFNEGKARTIADKNHLSAQIMAHLQRVASYEVPGVLHVNRSRLIAEFWSSVILSQGGK
jgi:uncharacterized protein (TIGR00159 family)